jgi:hypothetical protein
MRTERLVETLYRDLKPVRHQSVVRDAAILCVVEVVELAAFLSAGLVRPDMHYAMLMPSFWWKMGGSDRDFCRNGRPDVAGPHPVPPRRLAVVGGVHRGNLRDRLVYRFDARRAQRAGETAGLGDGYQVHVEDGCTFRTGRVRTRNSYSARRTNRSVRNRFGRSTWISGLGGFCLCLCVSVRVFACPSDDPLYIAVWYTVGCGLVTVVGRSILFWLSRW